MGTIQHICFDKDGTLIDVHVYWAHIIERRAKHMAEKYKLPAQAIAELCRSMGIDLAQRRILPDGPVGYKPRPVIIEAARTGLGCLNISASSEEIAAIFVEIDRWLQDNNAYDIKLLPHIEPVFKQLKEEGYKLSVFTSDRVENLRRIMRELKLESYLDAMVGGDEVKRSKPDPEGFQIACSRASVPMERSIYVSDTADDMHMSKLAGAVMGIGVTTGLDSSEILSSQTPFVFPTLRDLPAFLKGNERCTTPLSK